MADSLLARSVKYINIVIAVVVLVLLAAVYWFGVRPLPQTSGAVEAPVERAASVTLDSLGVPHIRAASEEDAFFVQGYVTAQNRLWQMDSIRRFAGGTLAEVVGPAAIDSDRDARLMRTRRMAETAYTALPPKDRTALAAYTRGVNHFISTHLNRLPMEFTLLGYQPQPWSVVDSILVALYMFRDLTTTWRNDLIKRNMSAAGDPQKVDYLFPARIGGEVQPGSNAWAIAGSRTASGKPLLSNDMHLDISLPGVWYMAHLQAPGLDVSGVTVPGLPGVVVGHNQRIAWGITNLQFDMQDLYIEKFDDQTGRYLYRGQLEQARLEREIIRVKGSKPVELANWVTRHGPLIVKEGSDRMALRWVAAEPGMIQYPFLEINRALDWREFTAALERFAGPGSNFVYADVDGNIGYHAAGKLPVRRGFRGDLPVDGASGDFEWESYVPFDRLPAAYNPPDGMIVTSNQNPFPPDFPYPVNGNFASPYRSKQVRDLLSARKGWRAEDLLAVQTDVYSGFSRFLASQIVAAYQKRNGRNPALDGAVALLRGWNGQMEKDQPAPFLITLAYQHVRTALAENAAPGKGTFYDFPMAPAVIEKMLRERTAGWFRDYDDMLLRALVDAVEEGSRMQGRDVARWRYGAYLQMGVNHPVIHQVPYVGPYFDLRPVPMSGSSTTVKQTTQRLAPSMRMNADLGDWDRSLLNLPFGQSGQILSRHYRDQWDNYYAGRSYPMQFRGVQAASTLEFRPAAK